MWLATLVLVGCVPQQGGWNVDELADAEPGIAALTPHRLGDMIPYPALGGAVGGSGADRIALIACRFRSPRSLRVRGGGPHWPAVWAGVAVEAIDRSMPDLVLSLEERDDASVDGERPEITVVTIGEVDAAGPSGLGDTLTECDVSMRDDGVADFRGELVGAEIRMRRAQLDVANRIRAASEEEWIGALMHELGHALGFAGHAAIGASILVRDQTALRAAGRRALRGETAPDPTLDALYLLRPGQRLGARDLRTESTRWLEAVRAHRDRRTAEGLRSVGVFASVGDEAARIVWRYADGSQLGVRMPAWRRELKEGAAITLVPDRATRAVISRGDGR
jgi:hypothetical protein